MTRPVTISNPTYNFTGGVSGASATIPVFKIVIDQEFESISEMTLHIKSDIFSLYFDDTDNDNNVLQKNSTATFQIDSEKWFTGYILKKPHSKKMTGSIMTVTILGPEGILAQSLCNYTSEHSWTMATDHVEVVDLELQASNAYGTFDGSTLWPDPADPTGNELDCYIKDALSPQDALDIGIDGVVTEIVLSTSNAGYGIRGWVKIDNEWIYFDGYDNAEIDGKYRLRNCVRGELGTAAVPHLATTVAYNKIGKVIAPQPIELQHDPGTGYVRLRYGADYVALASVGCFVLAIPATGTYKATLSYYDADATLDVTSTAFAAEDLIDRFVRADRLFGGAGFAPGKCNWDATNLTVTRYDYSPSDQPKKAWNAIHDFLKSISLEQQLKFCFNHRDDEFRLFYAANDTPTMTLTGAEEMEIEDSLEECYSAVRVEYSDDQSLNRATKLRSNHQVCTGVTTSPDYYVQIDKDGAGYIIPSSGTTIHTAAGTGGMETTVDGNNDSKLVAVFHHNPTGSINFGDWWFKDGVTPDPIFLKRINIRCGTYRVIEGWGRNYADIDNMYVVRLLGCDDYNTTTKDSAGTGSGWVTLAEIRGTPNAYGGSFDKAFSQFPIQQINGLRVVFDYMPGPQQHGDYYWGAVHSLTVEGDASKFVYVQTDDTTKDDPLLVYAPAAHVQLRGGINSYVSPGVGGEGSPRVYDHKITGSSEAASVSLSRYILMLKLLEYHQKIYIYRGILTSKPELGDTIEVDENGNGAIDYTGVLMGFNSVIMHDKMASIFRLKDWSISTVGS